MIIFTIIGVWFVVGLGVDAGCAYNDFAVGNKTASKVCDVALVVPTPMFPFGREYPGDCRAEGKCL
jgi:hypothetical protein